MTSELNPVARRLDRAFAEQRKDTLLSMVAGYGDSGLPIAVGMIVDGLVVRGFFAPATSFAAELDRSVSSLTDSMGPEMVEVKSLLDGAFERLVKERQDDEKAARDVVDKYLSDDQSDRQPVRIDDIEGDDFADYVLAIWSTTTLQLRQAKAFLGGEWVEIDTMRVSLSHVGAWWPLEAEQGQEVRYVSES
jgi:hypothetical protein